MSARELIERLSAADPDARVIVLATEVPGALDVREAAAWSDEDLEHTGLRNELAFPDQVPPGTVVLTTEELA